MSPQMTSPAFPERENFVHGMCLQFWFSDVENKKSLGKSNEVAWKSHANHPLSRSNEAFHQINEIFHHCRRRSVQFGVTPSRPVTYVELLSSGGMRKTNFFSTPVFTCLLRGETALHFHVAVSKQVECPRSAPGVEKNFRKQAALWISLHYCTAHKVSSIKLQNTWEKQEQQSLHFNLKCKCWCQLFKIPTHTNTLLISVRALWTQPRLLSGENLLGQVFATPNHTFKFSPFNKYANRSHSPPKYNLKDLVCNNFLLLQTAATRGGA